MSLIKRVQNERLDARKRHDVNVSDVLSLLEANSYEMAKKEFRDISDQDVIASAKSLLKKSKETLDLISTSSYVDQIKKYQDEINLISSFIPESLSEAEIREYFVKNSPIFLMLHTSTRKGIMIKSVKDYAESISKSLDMKLVASIVTELLNNAN